MYDLITRLLVANHIDRYSIGGRTEGLVFDSDGAVALYVQHEEPETDAGKANWLPAPEEPAQPVFRLYGPEEQVLSGRWSEPPVTKFA